LAAPLQQKRKPAFTSSEKASAANYPIKKLISFNEGIIEFVGADTFQAAAAFLT